MANPVSDLLDPDRSRAARGALKQPVSELLDHARGYTLDLSPTQHLEGHDVTWAPRRHEEPESGSFDTVVSILRATGERDLDRYAARVAGLLAPDGRLVFAEPTRSNGLVGQAQRFWRPANELSNNLRLHTDFRLALWRNGLSVFRVNRYEMPRRAWPLTSVAVGIARHTPTETSR